MTYQTAFPGFVFPDITLPNGFVDVSFRSDACPSWRNDDCGLTIFIDYDTSGPVFFLVDDNDKIDIASRDWAKILRAVIRWAA